MVTLKKVAEVLEAGGFRTGRDGPDGEPGLRQRHDERCAGLCQGRFCTAHRAPEHPGGSDGGRERCGGLIFVRDKHPEQDVLLAARSKGIPVLYTRCTMFEACGRLYELGLRGCSGKDRK